MSKLMGVFDWLIVIGEAHLTSKLLKQNLLVDAKQKDMSVSKNGHMSDIDAKRLEYH